MTRRWQLAIMLSLVGALTACMQQNDMTSNAAANRQSTPASNVANAATTNTTVANANTAANPEESFMMAAASGGIAEVELGRLAQQKAQSADVKQFGEMMVVDHTRVNEELKELATRKNITLPTSMGDEHMSTMKRLQDLSGAEFDRAYVEEMIEDHQGDVEEFEEKADSARDAEVKAFAEKTLPVLRRHLERIQAIEQKLK